MRPAGVPREGRHTFMLTRGQYGHLAAAVAGSDLERVVQKGATPVGPPHDTSYPVGTILLRVSAEQGKRLREDYGAPA